MTADQQPDPSRQNAEEAPRTPPPSSLPPEGRGTPPPGSLPPPPPQGPPPSVPVGAPAGPPFPGPPAARAFAPPPPPGPQGFAPPGFPSPGFPPPGFPQPGFAPWPPAPPRKPRNATGAFALALGVGAAALCWTFYLSPVGLLLGLLAVGCGLIGSGRAKRGAATNRRVALGGMWVGAGAAVVAAVLSVLLVVELSQYIEVESRVGSDYLAAPGDDVVYADGLVVRLAPLGGEGLQGRVTVTLTNESDGDISLADDALRAFTGDGLRLRDVQRADDGPESVSSGQSVEVVYHVALGTDTGGVAVDYRPADDYDWAFWLLDRSGGLDRGPADPDEDGPPGESLDV
ncbi:hypothetical protein SAMN06297387_11881 [Streptomyces zhaozhouensis]|uniref:DUF4190 domain-containing protein n=1 Tax=Streptomyces zhaozhouensis TaxID=1300267 RepID=A0A286E165_9ACTN|nr:hypothetical protein [Streptomyces zhaozhouensis]SOD64629.1 hypothetical protein SAMN06297387_11881 [Streptomyces zhaozhouensis]